MDLISTLCYVMVMCMCFCACTVDIRFVFHGISMVSVVLFFAFTFGKNDIKYTKVYSKILINSCNVCCSPLYLINHVLVCNGTLVYV